MTKPAWPRGHTLKVRVTPQERAEIERLAAATRLPVATFLRNLGLAYVPKSTLDAQHVRDLLKLGGDIGRLGGLLKLWLVEQPGKGASETDVRALLNQLGDLRGQIADKVAGL